MMKRLCLLLLTAMLLLAVFGAYAEEEEDGYWSGLNLDWHMQEQSVDYRSLGVPPRTRFAVYSAPFDSAWRAADGKAAVSAFEPFSVFATIRNGQWAWIEYPVSGGARRMGWAKLPLKQGVVYELSMEEHTPVRMYLSRTA